MFNEAFWFFYWVGIFDTLSGVFFGASLLAAISLLILWGPVYCEDGCTLKTAKRSTTGAIIVWVVLGILTFIAPSKDAMYAGAGQYVAETTEIDHTLLQLKDILDDKIAELAEE